MGDAVAWENFAPLRLNHPIYRMGINTLRTVSTLEVGLRVGFLGCVFVIDGIDFLVVLFSVLPVILLSH